MKKLKKVLVFLLIMCVAGMLIIFGINGYMILSVKNRIITLENAKELDADCIIVLGARVYDNGNPSDMLRDRLLTGISLYNEEASQKIIMSGDHGRVEYDEVNVMKNYAMEQGVPSEDVFMDHAGFSTYESIYRAKEIFGAENIIIVTQEYHLYRALYIAKSLGVNAYGVSADLDVYRNQWYRDFRELLARVKDMGYCLFRPAPTYLGERISLTGSGDVTNDK